MDAGYWDDRYASADLVWTATPNRFVVEECSTLPAGSALDLACGERRNAIWLAGQGWAVTGVDYSGAAVEKAARLAEAHQVEVTWVRADVLEYRPDHGVDLALLAYLQLPPPKRQQALRLAADATAPGGSILVVAHDVANLEHGVGGPQSADVPWTPAEVVVDGFTPARRETARRPTPHGDAWDTVVRLVRDRQSA